MTERIEIPIRANQIEAGMDVRVLGRLTRIVEVTPYLLTEVRVRGYRLDDGHTVVASFQPHTTTKRLVRHV